MNKYEALDALILREIQAGHRKFSALQTRDVMGVADNIATPNRRGVRQGWRLVDRRLQALRKSGAIVFDSKIGWALANNQVGRG